MKSVQQSSTNGSKSSAVAGRKSNSESSLQFEGEDISELIMENIDEKMRYFEGENGQGMGKNGLET